MPEKISPENLEKQFTIDVRSEGEFAHAHVPGAINIPLLNDENRKIIGTTYKQLGREAAVAKGFELVGPNFANFFRELREKSGDKTPVFYCWRGGLRSAISATIYEWGGLPCKVISGGYKAYRRNVLKGLQRKLNLHVLSGYTGVGKTEILKLLKLKGAQVIDLENLANHKGSALGGLGMPAQFSNEMFENMLYELWKNMNASDLVFLENESRKIGSNILPESVWLQMENSPLTDIILNKPIRLQRILKEYGAFPKEDLAACTVKLKKRLGGLNLKNALEALESGNISAWAGILMEYYDGTYLHGRKDKTQVNNSMEWDWNQAETCSAKLMELAKSIH
ncbi:MAG: tRNA 2-selenouridine(34) synthase MnmH [Bacteroidetes bacterium]|nr:tRNA 2-selenouridine(34) synthase MnmH [Bacteroidota bacterium]